MKCPYCSENMKYGVIQSQHAINWNPKKAKLFGTAEFNSEAIVIADSSFLKGSCVNAYCCSNCKKIIIDYGNEN